MRDIVLVAQDAAPSAAFKLLSAELAGRGFHTRPFLGEGTKQDIGDMSQRIAEAITNARILLLGMSSSPELARCELAAGMYADTCNVPVALLADSWDCISREWFKPLRRTTSIVFVVDEEERAIAKRLFPATYILVSGNPLWQNAKYTPISRGETRMRLGLEARERMVFCALTKNAEVNLELLRALVVAVQLPRTRGIVGFHPGDQTDLAVYDKVSGGNRRITIAKGSSKETLTAADVVLNGTSGVGIEAVVQGIPVLEFKGPAIREEEDRIYPSGWRLPERYPGLVREAGLCNLELTLAELLARDVQWKGVVGVLPTAPAIEIMTDKIKHRVAVDRA